MTVRELFPTSNRKNELLATKLKLRTQIQVYFEAKKETELAKEIESCMDVNRDKAEDKITLAEDFLDGVDLGDCWLEYSYEPQCLAQGMPVVKKKKRTLSLLKEKNWHHERIPFIDKEKLE